MHLYGRKLSKLIRKRDFVKSNFVKSRLRSILFELSKIRRFFLFVTARFRKIAIRKIAIQLYKDSV